MLPLHSRGVLWWPPHAHPVGLNNDKAASQASQVCFSNELEDETGYRQWSHAARTKQHHPWVASWLIFAQVGKLQVERKYDASLLSCRGTDLDIGLPSRPCSAVAAASWPASSRGA